MHCHNKKIYMKCYLVPARKPPILCQGLRRAAIRRRQPEILLHMQVSAAPTAEPISELLTWCAIIADFYSLLAQAVLNILLNSPVAEPQRRRRSRFLQILTPADTGRRNPHHALPIHVAVTLQQGASGPLRNDRTGMPPRNECAPARGRNCSVKI